MKYDIKAVKAGCDIVDVIGRRLSLKVVGPHQMGKCPFHNDSEASLCVTQSKQIFKCFACGESGDAIDFLVKLGLSFVQACDEITGQASSVTGSVSVKETFKKPIPWKPFTVVPKGTAQPLFDHYRHGKPSKVWTYKTESEQVIGYVCRFDTPTGKEIVPLSYAKNDSGQCEWRWIGFEKPRPLYGLDKLNVDPKATILIVEGEKCKDFAQAQFPFVDGGKNIIVMSWIGGPEGVHYTDWKPIHGRNIIIWPDNDFSHRYGEAKGFKIKPFNEQPGIIAALRVQAELKDHCSKIKFIRNPDGKPCGWDIADSKWKEGEVREYIKANLFEAPEPVREYAIEAIKPAPEGKPKHQEKEEAKQPDKILPDKPSPVIVDVPTVVKKTEKEIDERFKTPYFRFLGYEMTDGEQAFYFYSFRSNMTMRFKSGALSKNNLICLADINYWESEFPGGKSLDISAAVNYLIATSLLVGVHDPALIRGRGAWMDGENCVINVGSHLIVNNAKIDFKNFKSKFIYQSGTYLEFSVENPLTKNEANKLIQMLQIIAWDRDVNAYLLAGWCVIAPICGVLKWRPHIWITGAAGTGKSWTMGLIKKMLGNMAISAQGDTTEAGLRQVLNSDARPIMFDEAESEGRVDSERMQKVLSLMRSSSTNEGGDIIKGSAGGSAVAYKIRSCFVYSSIGLAISSAADRSRVSVLGIHKVLDENEAADRWERLQKLHVETISEDWVNRLRARTVMLTPIILKNAKTFSKAAASELGDQRSGDQIGALLAGAYTLFSNEECTFEQAVKFIKKRDWSEERFSREVKDEVALINHLMDCPAIIENQNNTKLERSVGEIIQVAADIVPAEGFDKASAEAKIRRMGFKIDGDFLTVSNKSLFISKCLQGTPWEKNHGSILARIKGAVKTDPTTFGNGTNQRAVRLPLAEIFDIVRRTSIGHQGSLGFNDGQDHPF